MENFNNIKEEVVKSTRSFNTMKKVAMVTAGAGVMYALGCRKGIRIGHETGRLTGYAQATEDLANMIKDATRRSK